MRTEYKNKLVLIPFFNIPSNFFKSYQDLINVFKSRELEVINLMSLGITSKEISDKLFISRHTVHTNRNSTYIKGKFNSLRDVILFALFEGFRAKNTH